MNFHTPSHSRRSAGALNLRECTQGEERKQGEVAGRRMDRGAIEEGGEERKRWSEEKKQAGGSAKPEPKQAAGSCSLKAECEQLADTPRVVVHTHSHTHTHAPPRPPGRSFRRAHGAEAAPPPPRGLAAETTTPRRARSVGLAPLGLGRLHEEQDEVEQRRRAEPGADAHEDGRGRGVVREVRA